MRLASVICLLLALAVAPAALAGPGDPARHQGVYGAPDTDGDGVPDARDRCPELPAMTKNGCPRVPRKVTIEASYGEVSGRVKSDLEACVARERVKLFRVRRGPDKRLERLRTDHDGEWQSRERFHHGRLYARVSRHTEPDAGRCTGARSHSIRV